MARISGVTLKVVGTSAVEEVGVFEAGERAVGRLFIFCGDCSGFHKSTVEILWLVAAFARRALFSARILFHSSTLFGVGVSITELYPSSGGLVLL